MTAPTPKDFLATIISMWEGGYSSVYDDAGNWVTTPDGIRIDVGTNRGVTPAALAVHRGVEPWTLTKDDMMSVTADEAVDIGFKHYYVEPNIALLPWGPATASLLDFAWMSGPYQAILCTQRLCSARPYDGIIGKVTVDTYAAWEASMGWEKATDAIHGSREAFYRYICTINPNDQIFLNGWLNRNNWASAADQEWWNEWGAT